MAVKKPTKDYVGGPVGSCRMIGRCLIQFHVRKVKVKSLDVRRSCNHAGLSVRVQTVLSSFPFLSHTHELHTSQYVVSVGKCVSV